MGTAVRLVVKAGAALRAVPRIFEIMAKAAGEMIAPSVSAVRSWLLRLGRFALLEPLPQADDWLLMLDLSMQMGTTKVCVIVGVRQSQLPPRGQALRLADLHLIGLHPVRHSTGVIVAEQLAEAARRVGIPRGITSDHGSDVKKGCELFAAEHPQTAVLSDAAHRGACLLKRRLEAHPQWAMFLTRLGQVRARLLQTEDAYLLSPSLRPKARYLNLTALLKWCRGIFRLLDQGPTGGVASQRASQRYGWLREYRGAISQWFRWDVTIQTAVSFVRTEGLSCGCEWSLLKRLCSRPESERHLDLERELFEFVRAQSSHSNGEERLLGSTEVLESLFGKWKSLERQESRSGITSLILGLGALLGDWPLSRVEAGLKQVGVKQAMDWCRKHLPPSVQSQRRLAFS